MSNSDDTSPTSIRVDQRVGTVGGGQVTAVEVASQVADTIVNQTVVDRRVITNQILNLNDPQALDLLVRKLAEVLRVDPSILQAPDAPAPAPHIARQIDEVAAAQQEVAAQGLHANGRALYELGILMAYRRNLDAALDYFRQAARAEPDLSDAHIALAWLQQGRAHEDLSAGDAASAWNRLSEARVAIAHADQNDARVLAESGYIAQDAAEAAAGLHQDTEAQRLRAESIGTFEAAARRFPDDPSVLNGLAGTYLGFGDYDSAINTYQRVIRLASQYPAVYHDLALAYEQKMAADQSHAAQWRSKALAAWKEYYRLSTNEATRDPSQTDDYLAQVSRHILSLESEQPAAQPPRKRARRR